MADAKGLTLVTGAAGDIGQALCRRLMDSGFAVVAWDLAAAPAGLDLAGWYRIDLSDEVPEKVIAATAAVGELRAVFHVVGGSDADELRQPDPARVPMDVFRRTVGLNLVSAYAVIRATVDVMRRSPGDRSYTLVSSTNALGGYGAPGYSAAKAGLHGLVRALAVPLGRDGIRINAVALGTTRTANYARLATELGRTADFAAIGAKVPRGSVLSPEEAAAALAAVGVDNPALSGSVIVADAAQNLLRR
jgi:NAD(P)-dependent dehydrogenase (short-subunit alcohol dehydrogenase family)